MSQYETWYPLAALNGLTPLAPLGGFMSWRTEQTHLGRGPRDVQHTLLAIKTAVECTSPREIQYALFTIIIWRERHQQLDIVTSTAAVGVHCFLQDFELSWRELPGPDAREEG
jgi:hypothetical protein